MNNMFALRFLRDYLPGNRKILLLKEPCFCLRTDILVRMFVEGINCFFDLQNLNIIIGLHEVFHWVI